MYIFKGWIVWSGNYIWVKLLLKIYICRLARNIAQMNRAYEPRESCDYAFWSGALNLGTPWVMGTECLEDSQPWFDQRLDESCQQKIVTSALGCCSECLKAQSVGTWLNIEHIVWLFWVPLINVCAFGRIWSETCFHGNSIWEWSDSVRELHSTHILQQLKATDNYQKVQSG